MARLYGRAPKESAVLPGSSRPLEDDDLHGWAADRWPRGAFCARRPMDVMLSRYVSQVLVPELTTGDVVIMDNLPAHKVHGVRQAIEAPARRAVSAGLLAGLQPIEMAFSKFKALLRAAAARTIPDLWDVIRIALDAFTPSEYQNYFAPLDMTPHDRKML